MLSAIIFTEIEALWGFCSSDLFDIATFPQKLTLCKKKNRRDNLIRIRPNQNLRTLWYIEVGSHFSESDKKILGHPLFFQTQQQTGHSKLGKQGKFRKWKESSSQVPLWHDTPCLTCELGLVLLCKARFFSCFVAIKAPSSDKSAFTLQKTPRKWNPFRDDTTLLAIQVVSSSTFIIVLTLQRDWRNKIDIFCFAFHFLSNLKIWIPILCICFLILFSLFNLNHLEILY